MIKNDRQYKLSKAQIREFETAAKSAESAEPTEGIHPTIVAAQKEALKSQIEELANDVSEYEALRAGKLTNFETQSLDELPRLLVMARIARDVTHKELADRLGVKEQQVQRWEFNDYSGASLDNLKAVADALGVVFTQRLYVPKSDVTAKAFLDSLSKAGLSTDFVLRRIVPDEVADAFRAGTASLKEIVHAADTIARVFDLRTRDLVELTSPKLNFPLVAATKFKLPARATRQAVTGYTIYAHYLAALVAQCVDHEPKRALPGTAKQFFEAVSSDGKPMTFEKVTRFLWDCGVAVLPLGDGGGFHGAVWKIGGKFVMVLKQATPLESRWLYDALHETGHIEKGHVNDDVSVVEDQEISPDASAPEEEEANDWAEEALFDSQSEEIEEACTRACRGRLQSLKAALPAVADDYNVNVGALANYMAYRLAQQRENWWGAANNLQTGAPNPCRVARDILLQNTNLYRLSEFDRALLQRALTEE